MRPSDAYVAIGLLALLVAAVAFWSRRRLPPWSRPALIGAGLLSGVLAVALFGLMWRGLLPEFSRPVLATTLVGELALVLAAILGGLAIYLAASRARQVMLAGLAFSAGALGMGLFSLAWPLDWINPTPSTRAEITLAGYRIQFVQTPGSDFYSDTFEISGQAGQQAFIYLNVDSYKCWVGSLLQQGDRVIFECWLFPGSGEISLAWLEAQMPACRADPCNLSDAYYEWTRVGR